MVLGFRSSRCKRVCGWGWQSSKKGLLVFLFFLGGGGGGAGGVWHEFFGDTACVSFTCARRAGFRNATMSRGRAHEPLASRSGAAFCCCCKTKSSNRPHISETLSISLSSIPKTCLNTRAMGTAMECAWNGAPAAFA